MPLMIASYAALTSPYLLGGLLVAGIEVGMVLFGQLAVRLGDLVFRGAGREAEYSVGVCLWHSVAILP